MTDSINPPLTAAEIRLLITHVDAAIARWEADRKATRLAEEPTDDGPVT